MLCNEKYKNTWGEFGSCHHSPFKWLRIVKRHKFCTHTKILHKRSVTWTLFFHTLFSSIANETFVQWQPDIRTNRCVLDNWIITLKVLYWPITIHRRLYFDFKHKHWSEESNKCLNLQWNNAQLSLDETINIDESLIIVRFEHNHKNGVN